MNLQLVYLLCLVVMPHVVFTVPSTPYSRFNLTCYDCDTQYTGDACHVITRFTPRSTRYNLSDEIMFCIFWTWPRTADGYQGVHRAHVSFIPNLIPGGAWKLFDPCASLSLTALTGAKYYEHCDYCQRDLCNTGLNSGRNYDLDGPTGNGSLETDDKKKGRKCAYKNPILENLVTYHDKVVSYIMDQLTKIYNKITY
uniref:Uncharacterized protein n=2 Tax=Cacopsylla melanoneura TaxID=428564 RepID=A0A8D8V8K4_9HEMI